MIKSEEYVVKFRMRNSEGYIETFAESVFLYNKGQHIKAEKEIIAKYRKAPYCTTIEVVSVVYQ